MKRLAGAVAVVGALAAFVAAEVSAAPVYRWTDEHGVVHFSQRPPAEAPADLREQQIALPSAPPVAEASQDQTEPDETRDQAVDQACLQALHRWEAIQRRPAIGVIRPGSNEPQLARGLDLQEQLARARFDVEQFCGQPPPEPAQPR